MEPLLRTENLTKTFARVVANDAISFDVRRGEIHCLLGENGAGKSTLSECLYGYYQPSSGRIYYKGERIQLASPKDAIRRGIGMVHQHFVLVPTFTVVENVEVGTDSPGFLLNARRARARLRELCARYRVELDLDARIWQLSVGEQQWVEILKALYVGAELLILDEPTAVLTPQETERLFAILGQMRDDGLSIVLITHKLNEVMRSDRVTILRKGKRVATVATAEVTREKLTEMMVGRRVALRVEKQAQARGAPVLEIKGLRARNDRGALALDGVDLTIHAGEILGLAGVAGNGQKELFETLIGARRVEAGEVVLDGAAIANRRTREIMARGVGHIPNDRLAEGLVPEFTVAENLILGRQRARPYRRGPFLAPEAIRGFAARCVDDFEITTPSVHHPVRFLSGGNAQKVILARELWQCSRCLLANQPSRGLDVGVVDYVHRQLLAKRREGFAILLASEELDEIFNLADRIAVMFKGRIMGVFDARAARVGEIGLLMAGGAHDGRGVANPEAGAS